MSPQEIQGKISKLVGEEASPSRDFLIAGSLVFFALSVYLLTYSGLFRSIDELTMYAQAEGLTQGLGAEAPQFQFAEYHHRFRARFEPFQALILTPLYFLGWRLSGIGSVQTVFLLNPLLSALTIGFFWMTLRELGYSLRTSILGGISLGFATLVWPYTRTLFREPMAAFTLAWALYFFARFEQKRALRDAVMCLIPLLISVASRSETIFSLVVFGVTIIFTGRSGIRFLAPIVLSTFALGGLILLWNSGYRFAAPASIEDPLRVVRVFSRQFNPEMTASRFLALTILPGKGLFIYSPLLLLAPWGGKKLLSKSRVLVLLLATVSIGYLLLYSMYFDWRGGVAWGPRLLVPLAVPLTLLAVPLFAARGLTLYATIGVMLLSTVIQFVASTADWTIYYDKLIKHFDGQLSQVFLRTTAMEWSPVFGQFQIWQSNNFDLVWLRAPFRGGPAMFDPGIFAVLLILFLVSVLTMYLFISGRIPVPPQRWLLAEGLLFGAGLFFFMRGAYEVNTGYWDTETSALREVAERVNASGEGLRLVVSVSEEFHYGLLMNFLEGKFTHYWLSPLQEDLDFLREPVEASQRILLITDSILPNSLESHAERWLNQEAFRYNAQWIGQYLIFEYSPPLPLAVRRSGSWEWPGILLLEMGQGTDIARPGETVPLEFIFGAQEKVATDYTFFVHLIRADGLVLDGEDAPPQYGAKPTTSWAVGETIIDRRALLIPEEAEEGEYFIEVGFTIDGERIQPKSGQGLTTRGTFIISQIQVTGSE